MSIVRSEEAHHDRVHDATVGPLIAPLGGACASTFTTLTHHFSTDHDAGTLTNTYLQYEICLCMILECSCTI